MTERQKRFVDFYIQTANAAEAARLAGYSENGARVTGAKLLSNPNISKMIEDRLKEMDSERIATAEESMIFLTSVVRGEFKEEVTTPTGKKVAIQIPTAQRIKAAETLLKIQGMFREKVDVKVDSATQFITALENIWSGNNDRTSPEEIQR